MAKDLTKMVEEWFAEESSGSHSAYCQAQILKAMAAEIERLKEEVDRLKWVNDPSL